MAYRYNRINWQNKPNVATPISAENLNKMDKGIDDNDKAIGDLAQLNTLNKSSLVSAVNELNNNLTNLINRLPGYYTYKLNSTIDNWETDLNNLYLSMPNGINFSVYVSASSVFRIDGYKVNNNYGVMIQYYYGQTNVTIRARSLYNGIWTNWIAK